MRLSRYGRRPLDPLCPRSPTPSGRIAISTDIWDYVAQDSALQADRLWDRFKARLQHLARWNMLGRPRFDLCANCRSHPFGKYCFYYRPTESGIEVLRILHSARDLDQIDFSE